MATRGGSVGAVQAINRPTVDSAVRYNDLDTIRFDGPGIYERLFPVCAGSAEAGVRVRTSADYTGDPPVLEILNVPGVGSLRQAMVRGAEVWNEISLTLTPTRDGFVRVRLISYDAGTTGACHFAQLEVTDVG